MAGSLYLNDFRLSKAYAEGRGGNPSSNPHPAGSPAALAYTAGAADTGCTGFKGPAECSSGSVAPSSHPGGGLHPNGGGGPPDAGSDPPVSMTTPLGELTVQIAGVPAAANGGQATLQIHTGAGGLTKRGVAKVTLQLDGAGNPFFASVQQGDNGHQILTSIAASQWLKDNNLSATVNGEKMTITNNSTTKAITKLTIELEAPLFG